MDVINFFPPHQGVSLRDLAHEIGATLDDDANGDRVIHSISPVARATQGQICYLLSRKHRADLEHCKASALICEASVRSVVPDHIPVVIAKSPAAAFARAGALLHPKAMHPLRVTATNGISPAAYVDPSAKLEADVTVEPMAVIGAGAEIGSGSYIGPGAIIGADVRIGRNCSIAGGASVLAALIGNNVIIHNGARIGQDGFGYAPGPAGMLKLVQVGRVILQDHVEIGANTTIDRGAMDDTVVGEGSKIDNQVQIAHNVRIGRHCALASGVGIAGSTRIGDGVQIGGATGITGHIVIGDGVTIAGMSGVVSSIPPGARVGGIPARPLPAMLRDFAEIMAKADERRKKRGDGNE